MKNFLLCIFCIFCVDIGFATDSQTFLTIAVTNPAGTTNGQTLSIYWQSSSPVTYTFTNLATIGFRQLACTNPAAKAATNIYTKLAADWSGKMFVTYGSSTSIVLKTALNASLYASLSTNWGALTAVTQAPQNNASLTVSNLNVQTINGKPIGEISGGLTNGSPDPWFRFSLTLSNTDLTWNVPVIVYGGQTYYPAWPPGSYPDPDDPNSPIDPGIDPNDPAFDPFCPTGSCGSTNTPGGFYVATNGAVIFNPGMSCLGPNGFEMRGFIESNGYIVNRDFTYVYTLTNLNDEWTNSGAPPGVATAYGGSNCDAFTFWADQTWTGPYGYTFFYTATNQFISNNGTGYLMTNGWYQLPDGISNCTFEGKFAPVFSCPVGVAGYGQVNSNFWDWGATNPIHFNAAPPPNGFVPFTSTNSTGTCCPLPIIEVAGPTNGIFSLVSPVCVRTNSSGDLTNYTPTYFYCQRKVIWADGTIEFKLDRHSTYMVSNCTEIPMPYDSVCAALPNVYLTNLFPQEILTNQNVTIMNVWPDGCRRSVGPMPLAWPPW